MNQVKKIITKQFPAMSKEDYSIIDDEIPLWLKHENFEFETTHDMMSWVMDDKLNFTLSDKVYQAMIDCLENNIGGIIVATIVVKHQSRIDILIRKQNFQKILSSYTEKLLQAERYEKLSEIKKQIQKYDLEI